MYSEKYNCLFVHIPKTAGKSIESFFLDSLGLSWEQRGALLLRRNTDPALGPERLAHLTATEYVSCGHLTQARFDSAFRFSFVRNPWARLVSEFRYRNLHLRMSFRDFVARGLPEPSLSDVYRHLLPQSEFLFAADGRCLVEFIGRFESLQADFDIVCERLGLNARALPHRDDGSGAPLGVAGRLRNWLGLSREPAHAHYSLYYDAATRDRVAAWYAADIEHFGYRFEQG